MRISLITASTNMKIEDKIARFLKDLYYLARTRILKVIKDFMIFIWMKDSDDIS